MPPHAPSFPSSHTTNNTIPTTHLQAAGGGPYSPTVTTPVTDFNLRANSVVREPQIQDYWAQQQVYEHLASSNAGVSSGWSIGWVWGLVPTRFLWHVFNECW